uniref:WD repeat domain-containing protein 83 n=1 Tax=Macrostomum lignano TaxID=282301 RepID=A0A1I8FXK8_9PLAT
TTPEQLQCRTVCGQGAVRCVRFNADGNYCLTGGADKSLKLWNPAKSLLLRSYLGHGQEVLAVACACDNANLASGGEDKMVAYWDTASGTAVRKYRSHLARVGALDFSPDATLLASSVGHFLTCPTLLASGSVDCTVRLWDLRSKAQAPVQLLTDARDSVTAVAVHSWRIYTASLDGRLRCYDARKGAVAEGLWFEICFVKKYICAIWCTCRPHKDRCSFLRQSGS